MLMAIAFAEVLMAIGRWSYNRYARPGIAKVYYIGDLEAGGQT
jgi:hypothetical protein